MTRQVEALFRERAHGFRLASKGTRLRPKRVALREGSSESDTVRGPYRVSEELPPLPQNSW